MSNMRARNRNWSKPTLKLNWPPRPKAELREAEQALQAKPDPPQPDQPQPQPQPSELQPWE
jgi:hypothetical protein